MNFLTSAQGDGSPLLASPANFSFFHRLAQLVLLSGTFAVLALSTGCGGGGGNPVQDSQNDTTPPPAQGNAAVLTYRNDNSRSGVNSQEISLTPANVNLVSFGKLAAVPIEGAAFAQPLFVSGVTISDGTKHDLVIVATEHDQVYAIDAMTHAVVWHRDFLSADGSVTTLDPSDVMGCDAIKPEIGITGTPVIDNTSGTIYLVARTKETQNGTASFYQRLHALDLTTGQDELTPTVISSPPDPNGQFGSATFDPVLNNQRSSLLLVNGQVYVAWASHCDFGNYQGWVMSFDASTLQLSGAWTPSTSGTMGGIWMAGSGPASDNSGDVYMAVGNGLSDAMTGGTNYGNSIVRLHSSGGQVSAADYFIPFNWQTILDDDQDLGAGGTTLFNSSSNDHPHLLIGSDKTGKIYLLDRDNLGHWRPSDNGEILQSFQSDGRHCFSTPAFWNNIIYFGYMAGPVEAYQFDPATSQVATTPVSTTGSITLTYPGASPVISANGTSNGILWVFENGANGILRAFQANNLSSELYDSEMSPERDRAVASTTFSVPTVANGQVFVAGHDELDVYGLLSR